MGLETANMPTRAAAETVTPASRSPWLKEELSAKTSRLGGKSVLRSLASVPPAPPKLPPVDISPNGDGWHEITSGKGDAAFTWRVQVRPYPEDRLVPIAEGAGFVRLTFDGIKRETIIKILDIYNLEVDERAGDTLKTQGSLSSRCILIPEAGVAVQDPELGRGRFSAAAEVEKIFARLSDRSSDSDTDSSSSN